MRYLVPPIVVPVALAILVLAYAAYRPPIVAELPTVPPGGSAGPGGAERAR